MAGRILPTFPRQASHEYRIVLGSRTYRVRLVWRWRLIGWYASIWQADGTPVVLNRRLSAGYATAPDLNVEGAAGDLLVSLGEEITAQDQLGDGLVLVHFTRDELPAPAAEDDAPTIEV